LAAAIGVHRENLSVYFRARRILHEPGLDQRMGELRGCESIVI